MRILLLGLTSNIGFKFYLNFFKEFDIYATYRSLPKIITNNKKLIRVESLSKTFLKDVINKIEPDIIINTIAEGNIDKCEQNYNSCKLLNVILVENLVEILKNKNIKLIHFSSNAIYNGENSPYSDNSTPLPVNNYGKSKLKADRIIIKNLKNYLLLRPITIIGSSEIFQRLNPATFIIDKLNNNNNIKLVNDDIVNFLYIDDLIDIMYQLIKKDIIGEFNISGNEILNRYELGELIMRNMNTSATILECSSKEFKSFASRAKNTSFDNSKIKNILNFNFTHVDTAIKKILIQKEGL